MSKLTKMARDKPCMVRLPGCTGGGPDTVLAHYRMAGYCGVGIKPPDVMGAWACMKCHGLCDSRTHLANLTRSEVKLAHAEGCLRTVAALQKMGALA